MMPARFRIITWRGTQVRAEILIAAKRGIDQVMADAVRYAKSNHPGWQNRTGTAEGSIRVQRRATVTSNMVIGLWGSVGVAYMGVLEFLRGSALRNSAAVNYPNLSTAIKEQLR